ncbi:KPN_02809 family neutral zinc metallopeptidase [Flavobacterium silvaticum]|uniref:Zinc metallopeptidase n=1 Tax=Flavobacterium silvaticum TaxID=1852020 RepID=A0A972JH17_9FLAO|nr:neutral zinc metallopeptidase [Flavobacterium silvaticum]NMH28766.1 zinc metallopeptidase [Flavobacterium silvaticum]
MKWMGRRESDNVDDRRGVSGGQVAIGGGVIGLVLLLINMFMGGDSSELLNQIQQQSVQQQTQTETRELTPEEVEMGKMVRVILADTEDTWAKIFAENGMTYKNPGLVLFDDGVETGCGNATSAAGPFYCPADQKVYIDLKFFNELKSRFGAEGGDFAIAYVIAHEVGHHVQTLLGTSAKVRQMQQGMSETEANKLSVALELQADFYAGLWAHYNEQRTHSLEEGDIEEALSAANAVGDDAIQKRMRGSVVPDSFTHGTSAQRVKWFRKGFEGGNIRDGDTFSGI